MLSVNHTQLENAFEHVYGLNGNAQEEEKKKEQYFGKFIDRFYTLQPPNYKEQARKFFDKENVDNLLKQEYLLEDQPSIKEIFAYWAQHLVEAFSRCESVIISPRELDQIMHHTYRVINSNKAFGSQWHLYVALFLCAYHAKEKELKGLGIAFDGEVFNKLFGYSIEQYLNSTESIKYDGILTVCSRKTNSEWYRFFQEQRKSHYCTAFIEYGHILAFFGFFDPYNIERAEELKHVKLHLDSVIKKAQEGFPQVGVNPELADQPSFFANALMQAVYNLTKNEGVNTPLEEAITDQAS